MVGEGAAPGEGEPRQRDQGGAWHVCRVSRDRVAPRPREGEGGTREGESEALQVSKGAWPVFYLQRAPLRGLSRGRHDWMGALDVSPAALWAAVC